MGALILRQRQSLLKMELQQKLRTKMLFQKVLVQLLSMINGLHLLYLVNDQRPDMRFLAFTLIKFYHLNLCVLFEQMVVIFQHGAAVVQDKMYIYGGNHNGRYLNDLHVSKYSANTCINISNLVSNIGCVYCWLSITS